MSIFDRILSLFRPVAGGERRDVDQTAYWDASERKLREMHENLLRENEERQRAALQIGTWARETARIRDRAPFPPRMMRVVLLWLPGLTANEIIALSQASTDAIREHVYGGEAERLLGVRKVRTLPPGGPLIFPKPVAPPQELRERAGGGGGPKRRFA